MPPSPGGQLINMLLWKAPTRTFPKHGLSLQTKGNFRNGNQLMELIIYRPSNYQNDFHFHNLVQINVKAGYNGSTSRKGYVLFRFRGFLERSQPFFAL